MSNRIMLKKSGPGAGYVEVMYGLENLVISHGDYVELDLAHYEFIVASHEKLPFAENPELRGLYDGWGWNVAELLNLVDGVEMEAVTA